MIRLASDCVTGQPFGPRRAARFADGWVPWELTPEDFARTHALILAMRREGQAAETVDDLAGMAQRRPWMAAMFTMLLFFKYLVKMFCNYAHSGRVSNCNNNI